MSNDNSFEVDISPEMQLYKILQRQSYGVETALSEFVDNSIQAYLDKEKEIKNIDGESADLLITIRINSTKQEIIIEDNASGITKDDFQRAIRMGHSSGYSHNVSSLSVYGIGMKSSAIWFSDTWKIETSAIGSNEKLTGYFDLNDLLAKQKTTMTVNSVPEKESLHYTKITITNSMRNEDEEFYKDTVLAFLKETFFKFNSFTRVKVVFDNLDLITEKAFLDTPTPLVYPPVDKQGEKLNDDDVIWKQMIDIDYAGRPVKGFVMIMKTGNYRQPGIRLFRNRRVIKGTMAASRQNKPEVLLKTVNKYTAQRIYGELYLDQFPVNFMKTDFDENLDGLYRLLRTVLSGEQDNNSSYNLINQATYYRVKKAKSNGKTPMTRTSSSEQKGGKKNGKASTQEKETPAEKIQLSESLFNDLKKLKNKKISRLYFSLCGVSLINDPILAYVGAWSLLESLATYLNKNDGVSFESFYTSRLKVLYRDRGKRSNIRAPIIDIHLKGNCNKHSNEYESVNAQQLENDFQILEPFLIQCVEDIVSEELGEG